MLDQRPEEAGGQKCIWPSQPCMDLAEKRYLEVATQWPQELPLLNPKLDLTLTMYRPRSDA